MFGFIYFNYELFAISFFVGFGFLFIVGILPVIVLHIQYLLINWNAIFLIDTEKEMASYESAKKNISFSFNDIASVTNYSSYGRNAGWYSFAAYRYCKITLVNNTEIIITCLMINDIENTLEALFKIKCKKELQFICFINAKY